MTSDTQLISMLSGVVIPILVAVVTKMSAGSHVKAIANAFLCAVSGALATVIPGAWDWASFGIAALSTWAVSVASHYGLWKPTGASGTVQTATAGVGIGTAGQR
jgi:hypothetical protein